MKLYFENLRKQRRLIAEPQTEEEAIEIIHAFCEERNFKIYYVRIYEESNGFKRFDVGSWSESFLLSIV